MLLTGHDWLGCASGPLADGGVLAAGVWDTVRDRHLAPTHLRVALRRAWHVAKCASPGARHAVSARVTSHLRQYSVRAMCPMVWSQAWRGKSRHRGANSWRDP